MSGQATPLITSDRADWLSPLHTVRDIGLGDRRMTRISAAHDSKVALVVAHQYWPTPGSATQRLSAMVGELIDRGWKVEILTSSPPQGTDRMDLGPSGERIHFVTGAEVARGGLQRIGMVAKFAFASWIRGRQLSFHVVVSDPPPTAGAAARILARRRRTPLVYYMADSWAGAANGASGIAGRTHKLIKWLEDKVLANADAVVAATHGMAEIAAEAGATRVETIQNGVPTSVFAPTGDKWYPQSPNKRPFFLYAGNAGVVHGAHVFAEAGVVLWRQGLEFDIVYMGYGSDTGKIAALQRAWPHNIHVVGNVRAETVAAAYRASLGALSSLLPVTQYSDARPIKSLTGLAAGCPPIYAGDGNFADQLKEDDLGFVSSYDVQAVVKSMTSSLTLHTEDPEGEASLRQRCSLYAAERFDIRITARDACDVIEAAVEGTNA